jgi:hypothetical protein
MFLRKALLFLVNEDEEEDDGEEHAEDTIESLFASPSMSLNEAQTLDI